MVTSINSTSTSENNSKEESKTATSNSSQKSVAGLEITDVAVYPVKDAQKGSFVKAFARITLNDSLVINGVRIIQGKKKIFTGFPQEFNREDMRGYDICFPISLELRNYIEEVVINKYNAIVKEVA